MSRAHLEKVPLEQVNLEIALPKEMYSNAFAPAHPLPE
jgi:hypothetical protein